MDGSSTGPQVRTHSLTRFLAILGLLVLVPPWEAHFHPDRGAVARYHLHLPWPNPTFRSETAGASDEEDGLFSALLRAANQTKRFDPFVAIWSPPRPGGDRSDGFWSTSVDWPRLFGMAFGFTVVLELALLLWPLAAGFLRDRFARRRSTQPSP